jgi:ATP-dependent helicase/nuclease subunit B
MREAAAATAVYTIPAHRSFADALAAGLIERFGKDQLGHAQGRILLPNTRAVRAVTDAFVRASGSGLLLPRLVPIGDPELDERIGGALEPLGEDEAIPPAIEPLPRLLALAGIAAADGLSSAEALRLAQDLARTLDLLLVDDVDPRRLAKAADDTAELALHWQVSLDRLRAIVELWPKRLAELGRIDLAERRNRLLRRLAGRWAERPPEGFTVAAGITTAAPAVTRLLHRVARMPDGMVVLPALSLPAVMPDDEWEALGPDENGRGEQTHPQYHLKLLLDRMGVARGEVRLWPASGRAASPAVRARAVANAMTAADFSHKWSALDPRERRLSGVRAVEFADAAAEAQGIALALRQALETPERTAALVTPDRMLARRVSALLRRWGIEADDSAGTPLSQTPVGTLLLGIASAAAEGLAPVPLLALLKHPLVGGDDDDRLHWLDKVRALDLALRGPRPATGIAGIDAHIHDKRNDPRCRGCTAAWAAIRGKVEAIAATLAKPVSLADAVRQIGAAAELLSAGRAWRGADGRMAAELFAELGAVDGAEAMTIGADDAVPVLRDLLERQVVRPPYGGHPRLFIWGLLEARLQRADLLVLGGLNEGVWPAAPAPDPWLAPKIRANLGLPGLEFRIGLSAHDFASALGAPQVLVTRARRDARAPTIASRFWLRLQAMTGGVTRESGLARWTAALDDPGTCRPAGKPAPKPPPEARPKEIWVTAVDRLKADPFAFYAREILRLPSLDPVDADHSAAWKGSAVHEVLQRWLDEQDCDPDKLMALTEALLAGETIHPMLRALWAPRLIEAIHWVEAQERDNRDDGRRPLAAECKGSAEIAGVRLRGRADRIDLVREGALAIVDYKTGKAPAQSAVLEGFSLQLGLLGLIAGQGGFEGVDGAPCAFEYWSLTKYGDKFGRCVRPDKDMGPEAFLAHAQRNFAEAAGRWLTGEEPFWAKLNPAYARYGDYDQLMRLEEWYGRK